MKKLVSLITITSLLAAAPIVLAENEITVKIDGNPVEFDVQPTIINERTMVPMRAIFENLGATVDWDDTTKTATGALTGIFVSFTIDEPDMQKNTISIPIDSPATIIDGRTLLPVRAVAESFGMQVSWDNENRIVYIDTANDLGSFTYGGDTIYKGQISNNQANGFGSAWDIATNTLLFTGTWSHGQRQHGASYNSDGSMFVGDFSDNSILQGTYYYSDGDWYDGNFSNNMKNGLGTYHWYDGIYVSGTWINDNLDGRCTYYYPDGSVKYSTIMYNGKTAQEAYAADKLKIDEEYTNKLAEIYELQMELFELQNTDPYSTEEAKEILGKYDMSTSSSAEGANGGNVDSYSAANAQRQQAALYAQAQETVLNAYNAKIKNMQDAIDICQKIADDWYNSEIKTLKMKYNIN